MQAILPARSTILALLVLTCGFAPPALADLIVLTNGREIRGRVLRENRNEVVLEVPYGLMTIPRRQVQSIEKETDDTYLRATGTRLLAFHDYETGLALLRQAKEQNPDSLACRTALIDGLCNTARAALDRHRFQVAESTITEAEQLAPDDPRIISVRKDLAQASNERGTADQEASQAVAAGDLVTAHEKLRWLVATFPEERERWRVQLAESALALAHQAVGNEDLEAAHELYLEALTQEPDLIPRARAPLSYVAIKRAIPYLEKGEFGLAVERLQTAQQLVPDHPALLYHLALAHEGSGATGTAAQLYARIAGADRVIDGERHLLSLRRQAEAVLTGTAQGDTVGKPVATGPTQTLETRSFALHHRQPELAGEAGRLLEHHLERIDRRWFRQQQQKTRWPGKLVVHLHPDQQLFEAAASPPPWSRGITRQARRYGLLTEQELHFDTSSAQFLTAVLPHELAHALLPYRLGTQLSVPRWLDEGIATCEEPAFKQQHYQRVVLEAQGDGALFPLATLMASDDYPEERARVELFYAQSNSVVRFLEERLGLGLSFELFRRLASRPVEAALEGQAPFASVGDLEREWLRWLDKSTNQAR